MTASQVQGERPVEDVAPSDGIVAWGGLEVRHLQALLAVSEEGTFSRAAERLGYTQSAISQQVKALERLVGAPLFERRGGPKAVSLTPEGVAMVAHARVVVARLADAAAELRAMADGEQGTLRVGTIQSVGRHVLPELLQRFRERYPRVQVRLAESQDPYLLLDELAEGNLDLMFAPLPVPSKAVVLTPVLDDPFVLLAPADSPEAGRDAISMDEIARLPLIGYRSDWCRTIVADRFAAAGQSPTYIFESDDNPTIQGLVGVGGAYCFSSVLSIDKDHPSTVVVPVEPAVEPRRLVLAHAVGRHLPAAAKPFIETATAVCADLAAGLAAPLSTE